MAYKLIGFAFITFEQMSIASQNDTTFDTIIMQQQYTTLQELTAQFEAVFYASARKDLRDLNDAQFKKCMGKRLYNWTSTHPQNIGPSIIGGLASNLTQQQPQRSSQTTSLRHNTNLNDQQPKANQSINFDNSVLPTFNNNQQENERFLSKQMKRRNMTEMSQRVNKGITHIHPRESKFKLQPINMYSSGIGKIHPRDYKLQPLNIYSRIGQIHPRDYKLQPINKYSNRIGHPYPETSQSIQPYHEEIQANRTVQIIRTKKFLTATLDRLKAASQQN